MSRLRKTYKLMETGTEQYPTIAVNATDQGVFEAVVSVFNNVDYQGDRVLPHAFDASIERWRKSGRPVPIVWSHNWADPFAIVGSANPWDVRELAPGESAMVPNGGLLVKGKFDLENPFAAQVWRLVRDRKVSEWSFSYDTVKERRADDGANELITLDLIEAGPTLKGANALTATLSAKAANAITPATLTDDGRRIRCFNCGRYSEIPQHQTSVFGGERVFIGSCTGCGALQGYSPKSWSPSKNAAALREIRGRAVWNILTALRDGGAPTEVIKSAVSSARYCLDDPEGYTVKEFADRVKDLIDSAVADDAATDDTVQKSVRDANLLKRLDELDTVGSKTGEKHRLLSTMNSAGLIIHLRDTVECRVEGTVITGTAVDLGESGVLVAVGAERYLVNANDVLSANSDLSQAVDELVADVRREKAAEDAEAKRLEEAHLYLRANTTEAERTAREQERRTREDAERERLSNERDAERGAGERSDEIRRRANWRQVGGADIKWGDN
jgi:HK97 family phage prohead protease